MATTNEMPSISGHSHTHSLVHPMLRATATNTGMQLADASALLGGEAPRRVGAPQKKEENIMANTGRRYVQIFIADPDPKVPIEQSLIYSSDPKMTDLDDQELFFEVEIKRLLDHYNETVRTKVVDKTIRDRTAYLEPVRIRDLAMNVTTIAKFG